MDLHKQQKFDDMKSTIRAVEGFFECLVLTVCYFEYGNCFIEK